MKKNRLLLGNWKLNGSISHIENWINTFNQHKTVNAEAALCVPSIYIPVIQNNNGNIKIGSQDVSEYKQGAYTGEVSSYMLKELNVSYALVGHSERREYFSEDNNKILKKITNLIESNITPVLCIGESMEQRNSNQTFEILKTQIDSILLNLGNCADKLVIAYEPIWAIGTGMVATTKQIEETHSMIYEHLCVKYSKNLANCVRILYGGSLKPDNAEEILSIANVDGGLVGGASLKVEDFLSILDSF